jgi:hypothetical protein
MFKSLTIFQWVWLTYVEKNALKKLKKGMSGPSFTNLRMEKSAEMIRVLIMALMYSVCGCHSPQNADKGNL